MNMYYVQSPKARRRGDSIGAYRHVGREIPAHDGAEALEIFSTLYEHMVKPSALRLNGEYNNGH